MNLSFLNKTKIAYVGINRQGFSVGSKTYSEIECYIRDIIPVRKLFNGRKIECYSNDAVKGKSGEFCAICRNRIICRQRIRLMLLLHEKEEETPAQMEINTNSFDNLRKALEPIEENELPKTLISIKIKKWNNYLQLYFEPLF